MRIRYGYRRLQVLLRRDGWPIGKSLVYRLYTDEDLLSCNRHAFEWFGGAPGRA